MLSLSFLFGEKDWPLANICCQSSSFYLRKIVSELTSASLPLFCIWDSTTAWFDERCVGLHLGSDPVNPRLLKQSA